MRGEEGEGERRGCVDKKTMTKLVKIMQVGYVTG